MKPTAENARATKTFKATLEKLRINLGWVIAFVPFDVKKAWGKGGRPKVRGTINGFEFRTSLFPTREGRHFILVNKQMQEGAGLLSRSNWRGGPFGGEAGYKQQREAMIGTVAQFTLEPDAEERAIPIPAELKRVLDEDKALRRWYDALSYSARKYLAYLITGVRSKEARERKAMEIAELSLSTMEAERELPPAITAAFAENSKAMSGWKMMTPIQRRGHLMGIFYYKNPASRAKRIAKAMADAVKVAERQKKSQNPHP
ncbi:MAG TPA: YdeI/OmpD-associated family protein [Candidatus Acidoferrum sp.]|nr:YdeI/OmpD-associated family protein [Candidatus Acidoferrum sp.]